MKKVAIVYDRVNKWGGAERVLLALHEMFPTAPLYTSVYSPKKAPWAKVFPKVIPSFLQEIPFMRGRHELLAPLMPIAFETLNFSGYDLVISVTSEAAKGIITKPPTLHICYCLTPTRYLWSHYNTYFQGRTLQAITKPAVSYLRAWDKIAAQRPDVMLGISSAVRKRISKYYGRESEMIYPPVETQKFIKQNSDIATYSNSEVEYSETSGHEKLPPLGTNFYLVVSRLVPYKKVDLSVEAFNELGLPLVVVGIGSEEERLRKLAKENISFAGFVDDGDLPIYYRNAKALIFPQEEDFGITAVEAQASGTPVIAYKKGGAPDTVIEGKTGFFFDSQNVNSLASVIRYYDSNHSNKSKQMRRDCIRNAEKFSKERFKEEFKKLVEKYIGS